MASAKEKLIREVFEYDRDIAYREFRTHHWNLPEIVNACPDPAVREAMLRGFWNQDAEKRYPEFREKVAGISMDRLLNVRAELIGQLNAIGLMEWRNTLHHAAARTPANDNERGPER
jgi:hypothetical protein